MNMMTDKPEGETQVERVLSRPVRDRMLTGVAAGIARYAGVDATLVRIAFVVLTLIGGAGIPLYLVAWLLIPEDGCDQSIASQALRSLQTR